LSTLFARICALNTNQQYWLGRLRWLTDGLLGAALGASVYAAWVFFVNLPEGGVWFALQVSVPHWIITSLLTYYGTAIMRFCFRAGGVFVNLPRALMTFLGGILSTYGVLVPLHGLVLGTPNILLTLAAGLIPTFLFCISYALLLARTEGLALVPARAG